MSYLVLARKYRPRDFAGLVGQEHVVQALANALTRQRLHHAYLFTGTRGVGKTTVSRILAKALNCTGPDGRGGITAEPCGVCAACRDIDAGRHVDYVELDAASNRGVEEIGRLLDQAVYKPVVGRFKVYMIDEVHMLSSHAFNAMLKTLEEPPEYLKFVLATTDPQKVPPTVLSRCLQFNLRPMAPHVLEAHLADVLAREAVDAEAGALRLIARAAHGSMRDALSLADQAIAHGAGALAEDGVRQMLGAVDRGHAVRLVEALARRDGGAVVDGVGALRALGLSAAGTLEEMAALLQQMAVAQAAAGALDGDDPDAAEARRLAPLLAPDETQLLYSIVLHGRAEIALAPDEYGGLVMVLLRLLAFAPAEGAEAALPAAGPVPAGEAGAALPAPRSEPDAVAGIAAFAVPAGAASARAAGPAQAAGAASAMTGAAAASTASPATGADAAQPSPRAATPARAGEVARSAAAPARAAPLPVAPPAPGGAPSRDAGRETDREATDARAFAAAPPRGAAGDAAAGQAGDAGHADGVGDAGDARGAGGSGDAAGDADTVGGGGDGTGDDRVRARPAALASGASSAVALRRGPPVATARVPARPADGGGADHRPVAGVPATLSAAGDVAPRERFRTAPAAIAEPPRGARAAAIPEPPPWIDAPPAFDGDESAFTRSFSAAPPSVPPPGGDGDTAPARRRPAEAAAGPAAGLAAVPPPHDAPPPSAAAAAPVDPQPLRTPLGDRWEAVVRRLVDTGRVTALTRELAVQSECVAVDEPAQAGAPRVWRLRVGRDALRLPAHCERLQAALAEADGCAARVEVDLGATSDTPALREAAERQRRQQEAERAIRDDPVVCGLLSQFPSARIVPGTVRPA